MSYEILNSMFFYEYENFYIFSQPKVASSWLHNLYYDDRTKENTQSFYLNQLTFEIQESTHLPNSFLENWKKFVNDEEIEKDFVFLMRDPITKTITGLLQDVIYDKLNLIIQDIKNYQNLKSDEIDELYNFHVNQPFEEWWRNPTFEINNKIEKILSILVDKIIQDIFNDVQTILKIRDGHSSTNYFFLHRLLKNLKKNQSKIKIIDIEKENIFDYLKQTYNLSKSNEFKNSVNKTAPIIKKLIFESIYKNRQQFFLSTYLQTDILIYCDIFNSVYDTNLTVNKLIHKIFSNNEII